VRRGTLPSRRGRLCWSSDSQGSHTGPLAARTDCGRLWLPEHRRAYNKDVSFFKEKFTEM